MRTGPARPSTESGFYDMGDTLSTTDVAMSRKTSAVTESPALDDIQVRRKYLKWNLLYKSVSGMVLSDLYIITDV